MDKKDYTYILAAFAILLDVAITLSFWEYEANPVVVSLGPELFVLIKLVLVLGLGLVWYKSKAYTTRLGYGNMALLIVFHFGIVLGNLWYLTRYANFP